MSSETEQNSQIPDGFKTHGEKMYDLVFNQGINFWANLIISAGFTYWVNHSKAPIMKTPPTWAKWLGKPPIDAQSVVRNGIHDAPFMNIFGAKMAKADIASMESITNGATPNQRMKVAKFMADAMTLTSVGTFIMVPGVWGAQKIKGDFVRWQDSMHYGNNAEDITWVHEAHDRIDHEKKPTLLGYAVGRVGSMAAVQATAYTVGHGDLFKWVGNKTGIGLLKKFEGVDHLAGNIGDALGASFASTSKTLSRNTNKFLTDKHIDWSLEQQRWAHKVMEGHHDIKFEGLDAEDIEAMRKQAQHTLNSSAGTTNYNRAFQDFGKYVGLDTLYTAVTAGTIVPFVGWLKQNIPGMSYTVEPKCKEKPNHRIYQDSITRDNTIEQRQQRLGT